MNRSEIVASLLSIGVPEALLSGFPDLPANVTALLAYGSRARGDALPDSDLDLLALANDSRASINTGAISISFYTAEQLATGIGTLFGAHLKRDAKMIFDSDGHLDHAIQNMGSVDAQRVLQRSSSMSELFTTPELDLPQYLPGLTRQARYLLRSCLYALAIQEGAPCFSVRSLAIRHEDARLTTLLSSRPVGEASPGDYDECLLRLESLLGAFPNSRHGSLEATVVNEWGRPSDLLSMAYMALGRSSNDSDYAEVEKILL